MKNEQLCLKCRTGKDTYLLDDKAAFCPHIGSHTGVSCAMFVPLPESGEAKEAEA